MTSLERRIVTQQEGGVSETGAEKIVEGWTFVREGAESGRHEGWNQRWRRHS